LRFLWLQLCGEKKSSKNLELHHLNPLTKRSKPSNIMVICRVCHDKIHTKLARLGMTTYADFIREHENFKKRGEK